MLYIYGASGHGKVIAEIAEANGIEIGGFIDDNKSDTTLLNYPVYASLEAANFSIEDTIVFGIGANHIRELLSHKVNTHQIHTALVHPKAVVSPRAKIGDGTVVMAGVVINADVVIGIHSIINTNASIDHDCEIGDYVHISPNVGLAGGVKVGDFTHIGIGANVIQYKSIGDKVMVGAGAVILKDVPSNVTIVGNPGKIIK